MKNRIIRINDISEIDTAKASVYDLNNRYIDRNGDMYCLRYNRGSRKIDIVKIMRTHMKNASYFQQKIIKKKIDTSRTTFFEDSSDSPLTSNDKADQSDNKFDPEIFINDSLYLMNTHKDRLKGIIMNVKNSNIVTKENKTESSELEDIFRNLELDYIQSIEKTENYQKELVNYPRSLTYYQAKIDKRGRNIIDALAGYSDRAMKFIYIYEMFHAIQTLYRNLYKTVQNLNNFIEERDLDHIKALNQHEKQYFNDAKVSIRNTIDEIEDLLDGLKILEDYVYEPNNF